MAAFQFSGDWTELGKQAGEFYTQLLRVFDVLSELDSAAHNVAKEMGLGREMTMALRQNFADAASGVRALGGELKDVQAIQAATVESLGRALVLNKDAYADLYAAAQISGAYNKEIISGMKDVGISVYNAAEGMRTVINTARDIGVSVEKTSDMVLQNISMMNKYNFKDGVEGLAKMAAQAVNMRITISDISGMMQKAFEPESAIEMAAAMQRLGVTQSDLLDPLRLLDLATNDPTELMNQVSEMAKSFVRLNEQGNFEILPGAKRQLIEIEKELGLATGSLSKMALSSFELDDKLKKIKFAPDIKEEDRKFLANMAEMDTSGTYKISFYDETQKKVITESIDKLSESQIESIKKANKAESLEDIQKSQLSYLKEAAASLSSVKDILLLGFASSIAGKDFLETIKNVAKIPQIATEKTGIGTETTREASNRLEEGLSELAKKMETQAGYTKADFDRDKAALLESLGSAVMAGGELLKNTEEVAKSQLDKTTSGKLISQIDPAAALQSLQDMMGNIASKASNIFNFGGINYNPTVEVTAPNATPEQIQRALENTNEEFIQGLIARIESSRTGYGSNRVNSAPNNLQPFGYET